MSAVWAWRHLVGVGVVFVSCDVVSLVIYSLSFCPSAPTAQPAQEHAGLRPCFSSKALSDTCLNVDRRSAAGHVQEHAGLPTLQPPERQVRPVHVPVGAAATGARATKLNHSNLNIQACTRLNRFMSSSTPSCTCRRRCHRCDHRGHSKHVQAGCIASHRIRLVACLCVTEQRLSHASNG